MVGRGDPPKKAYPLSAQKAIAFADQWTHLHPRQYPKHPAEEKMSKTDEIFPTSLRKEAGAFKALGQTKEEL